MMGKKHKDIEKRCEGLEEELKDLKKELITSGAVERAVGYGSRKQVYAGNHRYGITSNKANIGILQHKFELLFKHLGIELEHVEVNEWRFVERKDTDE